MFNFSSSAVYTACEIATHCRNC